MAISANTVSAYDGYSGTSSGGGLKNVIIPSTRDDYEAEVGKQYRYKLGMEYEFFQDGYQNFNRFYNIYNDYELSDLKTYVFITRPDLNILTPDNKSLNSNVSNDDFFRYMNQYHHIVLKSITSRLDSNHDFIPVLMERTESMQLQDYSIKNYNMTQMFTGEEFQYAGNAIESTTGGTFDITFREDVQLRLSKMFYAWIYYIDGVTRDRFKPTEMYIRENKLDYVSSVYYIVCAPDGRNILFWSKHTGVFPLNVPLSNISHSRGSTPENKLSISFGFSKFEALKPYILMEFNRNSRLRSFDMPSYDPALLTGETIVGAPYIKSVTPYRYELCWNKKKAL